MGKRFPYEPPWSPVGPHGAKVRVRQRAPGVEARLIFTAPDGNGYAEEPLGYSLVDAEGKPVEKLEAAAKREAAKLSNLRLAGDLAEEVDRGPLTLGELADRHEADEAKGPKSMSEQRASRFRRRRDALCRFFGRDLVVMDLAPSDLHKYADHRRRGLIDAHGRPVPEGERREVSKDTASKDLQVLRQLCRWATRTRWGRGEPFLLDADPTRAVQLEWNEDPTQPIVTDEMLAGLREVAPEVQVQVKQGTREEEAVYAPTPLPVMIEVANGTGRRRGALVALRWGDWQPQVEFPELGLRGALTFRGEHDKRGRTETIPVLPEVREALEAHRATKPDILPEEAPIFESPAHPGEPVNPAMASKWLRKAEVAARGHHVHGFGWHSFRRRWVNRVARKLPPATAARLGGWENARTMQQVYERLPDLEETARALAEVAEVGGAG